MVLVLSYDILSKFIGTKILRFDNGSLSLLDRNMIIIPVEVILKMQEDLEGKIGSEAAEEMIYNAGRFETLTGSIRYLQRRDELKTVFSSVSKTGDPSIEMGREMLKFMGKGDIKIKEMIDNGRKIVLSSNSPFSAEYLKTRGKSKGPVCHYLRGVMCGVMEAYYGGTYKTKETICAATGLSKECVFEFIKE